MKILILIHNLSLPLQHHMNRALWTFKLVAMAWLWMLRSACCATGLQAFARGLHWEGQQWPSTWPAVPGRSAPLTMK